MHRRRLLTSALATMAAVPLAKAQVFPPAGHATPIATYPFTPDVYAARRAALMAQLKEGIAVIWGAQGEGGEANVAAPFQQDGDFAWLTGIVDEPGAVLVLVPAEPHFREFLLLPSRNPEVERWDVERLPLGAEIERRTGFARVLRTGSLGALVTGLAERSKVLHFLGPVVSAEAPVPPALELYGKISARVPGCSIRDNSALLPALRTVKEPRELALIRKATQATRAGHLAAMRGLKPGMSERALRDLVEAAFRSAGGDGISYNSIVGAGRNAASLHYTRALGAIGEGDLVLIDAAASVGTYTSDITRTLPASGRFTREQRATYDLVLEAQGVAASRLKAGVTLHELTEAARDVFRKAGRIDDFYHGLGHYVGLDVHDAGDYSRPIPAGAVITIEPGLYVQSANYGIRIEDLYLVTPTGAERLSADIPRSATEIESAMKG